MPRAPWARTADRIAGWFGITGKGTTRLGRARIPFSGARIETRTVISSSAIAKAEHTKPRSLPFLTPQRWLSVLISRRHPNSVALIVDRETAESICRFLARSWSSGTIPPSPPPSDSHDFVGGTE